MKIMKNHLGSRGSGSGIFGFFKNPINPIMNKMKIINDKWDAPGPDTASGHLSLRRPQASSLKPLGLGRVWARPEPARPSLARLASGWPPRGSGNAGILRNPIINIMNIMNNECLVAVAVALLTRPEKCQKVNN